MELFDLRSLADERKASGRLYLEFLRKDALSVGLYVLEAGGVDPQSPHTEDEVYYVISGRGRIAVGGEDQAVEAGTTVFVEARVAHRFHSIEEKLQILVFFAPAEYTNSTQKRMLM